MRLCDGDPAGGASRAANRADGGAAGSRRWQPRSREGREALSSVLDSEPLPYGLEGSPHEADGLGPGLDFVAVVPLSAWQVVGQPLLGGLAVRAVAAGLGAEVIGTDLALAGDQRRAVVAHPSSSPGLHPDCEGRRVAAVALLLVNAQALDRPPDRPSAATPSWTDTCVTRPTTCVPDGRADMRQVTRVSADAGAS